VLGFVTGAPAFPAVGRFAYLAGPGDSTLLLFGCSFPNTALRFQPHGEEGYVAEYRVHLTLRRDGETVASEAQTPRVRVGSFRETSRTEESVIFQTRLAVPPGAYSAEIEIRDPNSGRGFRQTVDLLVPDLGPGRERLATPLLVYRVDPRTDPDEPPDLILNPRATLPFGQGRFLVYLEAYDDAPAAEITVADTRDEILRRDTVPLTGSAELRTGVLAFHADQLPAGAYELRATLPPDGPTTAVPLLVSISERWLATDFVELAQMLRYAGTDAQIDSLRNAPPQERADRWRTFWQRTDPVPATPENEYLEEYLARVRDANATFSEPQRPGWLTDRGEVYITLGPPDQVFADSELGTGSRIRWLYDRSLGFELRLDFLDRTGFGQYELTPDSRARFREAAQRLRRTL
jgi:GWxTD domain-containing protein